MRKHFAIIVAAVFLLAGIVAAQSAAPVEQPSTASGCLKATRDSQSAALKSAGTPINNEKYQAIQRDKIEFARACIAKLQLDTAPAAELTPLADLYVEAGQPDLADATITKALAATGSDAAERSKTLASAMRITMRQPKSDARNQKAERLVADIEKLPDTMVRERIEAHAMLNSYYRADDIDAGIISQSRRIIELNAKLTAADRVPQLSGALIAAYENLAEALAGQEQNAQALAVLRRAAPELPGLTGVADRLAPTIERYELVGKPGAPIEAPRWLNTTGSATKVEMPGAVTWLQFTAHWCGPCRKSYPGIARMHERFGAKGFRVVMATQLYGYFETQRNLTPDAELAAIKEYFPKSGIVFPVAVADNIPLVMENGKMVRKVNVNDASYKVGGIPQIQILDKKGIVRLIVVGWDETGEARLAAFISRLLAE